MAWNEYRVTVAAEAPADARAEFIRKVYLHLLGAIVAFVALMAVLDGAGVGEAMLRWVISGKWNFLVLMLGFMFLSHVADRFATQPHSAAQQYGGLALYVVAEAFIFLPLITLAAHYVEGPVLQTAAVYTGIVFGGATGIVFLTGRDFSFMRQGLMVAGWGLFGVAVCGMIFGFSLGMLIPAIGVLLAAGYIVYYTGQILHRYPVGAHVAASLALFASVALLFWYVLQLVMSRRD